MLRDRASISAMVCSAVLSVLPVGRVHHHDAQPRGRVLVDVVGADAGPHDGLAAGGCLPATSAVIFTPLRQIAPSNSARAA